MNLNLSNVEHNPNDKTPGIKFPKIMNEELAEFLGIMLGDGCLSRYAKARMIYICGHKIDDFEYHSNITIPLLKNLFDKDAKICFKKDANALFIRFSDKNIFNFLTNFVPIGKKYTSLNVPDSILKNKKLIYAFFRGLIDTDGCVVFSKQHKNKAYYPRIELSSKSKDFLIQLLEELKKQGFYGSISHKGNQNYRLELPGHKNLKKYLSEINFHNPKIHEKLRKNGVPEGI